MKFRVGNMSCIHCQKKIEKALKELGIKKIKIDLEEKLVTVALKKINPKQVEDAVTSIGYEFEAI